ncbi:MBOAT, membrane-bound O-acyltransferase family-domain-containing protein [Crepidotus variabilis]|uniref:MBOAT, membrane-bound O-acyltransferase family-domain-containing protein n=1 Tax=Crepidotus variabilis TaxID=179855 RepID=A0A9P6JMK9_9AGAR|nr:MBOAT, membrane-bound O-acyltransferase family-domain-containing protein [Crepidotus variabilis]
MSPATRSSEQSSGRKAEGVARLTVHIPSAFKENDNKKEIPKARWNTLEFRFYYLVALISVPLMVWVPVSLSQPSHRHFHQFAPRLSQGWLHNRMVDNTDPQYRSFRNNLLLLSAAAAVYLGIKFFARRWNAHSHRLSLIPLNVVLSLATVVALHGFSAIKILAIICINFFIARLLKGSIFTPILTWIFNGAVLFTTEMYQGYPFEAVFPALGSLDTFKGAYPRWHVIFNITMLRLISFNMDYYWACRATEQEELGKKEMTDKQRVSIPHKDHFYSLMNYIAYVLYPPLYIGGPIITFNDFMWQHRRPLAMDKRSRIMYLFRFFVCFMTMEYILHFMYVVAIKNTKAWWGDSPAQIAMIGFWNLIVVWLKLLIPWRFFRAWALLDGIDPPENMVRCMVNNYSALGFWRSWHRSYNLWIIRYIYVPLGGAKNVLLNTLLVFTFVALWHDLTFKLLAWGWLVSLFIIPELVATWLLPPSKYGKYSWFRHVCAIGAIFNMIMMVTANLVGFVIGTDGVQFFLQEIFGTADGIKFMVAGSFIIFVGVQFMFEYREEEKRQGIIRRC